MSQSTTCHATGTVGGTCKTFDRLAADVPIGFGGVLNSTDLKDNLASVPTMRSLGYQFWFGDYPYMITPGGLEVPLYVKHNGYLAIRIHPTTAERRVLNAKLCVQANAVLKRIGYLSTDVLLWHRRFCHISTVTLMKMKNLNLVNGLPKLKVYHRMKNYCMSCGMGKSVCAHIGPINHANKEHNQLDAQKKDESKQHVSYPLEQLHLDTCEMDSPDIYGNQYFLVIVDRETDYIWSIPMKQKKDTYRVFKDFLETVVQPYHRLNQTKVMTKPANMELKAPESGLFGIRRIRCDFGSEFRNKKIKALLKKYGGKVEPTSHYVNDGRAEAAIKKLTTR